MSVFSVTGLNKLYGTSYAIEDISFEAHEGSIGLLGPNGAGKSTLIKILLGLIVPSSGSCAVMGQSPGTEKFSDMIGYMPEHDCLDPTFTGVGYVTYLAQVSGLSKESSMERAHDILDYVGLGEARYRKIKGYSAGMKQKVKLAQALVHDPKIIFFDEPANGLDPDGREEMLALIKDVANSEKTVILSSHLLPDIEKVCNDVIIMHHGKLLLYDSLSSLRSKDRMMVRIKGDTDGFVGRLSEEGYAVERQGHSLLVDGPDPSAAVLSVSAELGVELRYMAAHTRSLEDLFLELVSNG